MKWFGLAKESTLHRPSLLFCPLISHLELLKSRGFKAHAGLERDKSKRLKAVFSKASFTAFHICSIPSQVAPFLFIFLVLFPEEVTVISPREVKLHPGAAPAHPAL